MSNRHSVVYIDKTSEHRMNSDTTGKPRQGLPAAKSRHGSSTASNAASIHLTSKSEVRYTEETSHLVRKAHQSKFRDQSSERLGKLAQTKAWNDNTSTFNFNARRIRQPVPHDQIQNVLKSAFENDVIGANGYLREEEHKQKIHGLTTRERTAVAESKTMLRKDRGQRIEGMEYIGSWTGTSKIVIDDSWAEDQAFCAARTRGERK